MTYKLIALVGVVLLVGGCTAPESGRIEEQPDFAPHFEAAGVSGTFVLYDPVAGRTLVHNPERAAEPFLPASTFKILNALIALETGAAADTATVVPWDGVERSIAAWNRDHTLASGFRNSTVWYYQEMARRIGAERMQDYVQRADYGNGDIGGGLDVFWLMGDLRITALEQVAFLERLHRRELPFSPATMDAVSGIMIEDQGPDYVLRAKTGWGVAPDPDVG
ncbi:MAG: penicillin-binding transpeptidase domain-containing protein, partial [Bacteroidota bacterium]